MPLPTDTGYEVLSPQYCATPPLVLGEQVEDTEFYEFVHNNFACAITGATEGKLDFNHCPPRSRHGASLPYFGFLCTRDVHNEFGKSIKQFFENHPKFNLAAQVGVYFTAYVRDLKRQRDEYKAIVEHLEREGMDIPEVATEPKAAKRSAKVKGQKSTGSDIQKLTANWSDDQFKGAGIFLDGSIRDIKRGKGRKVDEQKIKEYLKTNGY